MKKRRVQNSLLFARVRQVVDLSGNKTDESSFVDSGPPEWKDGH